MNNNENLIVLLQNKIHNDIPLSQHMGVKVVSYVPKHLLMSAPLENNINHRQTAFGGSITSLATLCCWGLLYLELHQLNISARIVIQDGNTNYLKLADNDFQAECHVDQDEFARFIKAINRKNVARIKLISHISCDNILIADFSGNFVAKKY